jgi:hypothetical protein
MFMMLIFLLPSVLVMFNVFDGIWIDIVKYMPSEVTLRILSSAIVSKVDLTQYLFDVVYLFGFGFIIYRFVVIPGFKKFATEYLGV